MDYEEAKTLIENTLHTYVRLNSTLAASKRFDRELAKLLAALLGRKPTKEEIGRID